MLYEEIYRKRLYHFERKKHRSGALFYILLPTVILAALFYFFDLTSFWACTSALIILSVYLIAVRKDLFMAAFGKAILMTVIIMPVYWFLILFSPRWVDHTYLFNYLSSIKFTGIPIEELVFWFLFGFTIGPFYEYWQGERLRAIPQKKK